MFEGHNFRWQKTGKTGRGLCPFHKDKKNSSLGIYLDQRGKQKWHCFACQIGYTEVDLVMRALDIPRDAANRWLANKGYITETVEDQAERVKNELYEEFYRYCNDLLRNAERGKGLRAYLTGRGVNPEFWDDMPIGLYPSKEEVEVWLGGRELPEGLQSELLPNNRVKPDSVLNSLAFFYRSSFDVWSRVKLRNPLRERDGDKTITYLGLKASFGNSDRMFFSGSKRHVQAEHAIVVEGEVDVLALYSLVRKASPDYLESIYCFGGGGNMLGGVESLKNCGVENIYIFPDNDKPGIQYAFDIADTYPHTYVMMPKEYEELGDPASWALTHELEDLQYAFANRIPSFQWIGKKLAEEFQNGSVEDQSHAKERVLKYAKKLSPASKEEFLKSYAPLTGISYEALAEEVLNYDNTKYKKILTKDGYGVYMKHENAIKRKIEWVHISNAIVEYVRDVMKDDGKGKQGSRKMSIFIKVAQYKKDYIIELSPDEVDDDRKFVTALRNKLGSDLWIRPKSTIYLRESASELSDHDSKTYGTIYKHTGWVDNSFIMPGGYVDDRGYQADENFTVELMNNTVHAAYHLDPAPADMDFARDLVVNHMLKVFPYEITLPLIGHFFMAPFSTMLSRFNQYCMWLHGTTGSFKTTYASLLNCFFGDFMNSNAVLTWRSTANAVEVLGSYLKDVAFIVDDYKKQDIKDMTVTTLDLNRGFRQRCRSKNVVNA